MRSLGPAALSAVLLAACTRAPAPPSCPPEGAIEALHAAAFHLEHGDSADGRAALARAAAGVQTPELQRLRARLAAAAEAADADARRRGTEEVRAELAGWTCLPAALHARFHARLPPLDQHGLVLDR